VRSDKLILRIPVLSKIQLTGPIELFGKIESGYIKPGMKCALLPTQDKMII
jgi:translation elongation factor EF-1alpha